MKEKQVWKITVDLLMTVALLLLMAYERIGQTSHEVIGTAMFLLFVLHHILNRNWLRNFFKGRYSPYRFFQTLLVTLIFVTMLTQMVSGILLSRQLYTFLPVHSHTFIFRTLHMLGAYWNFVLMGLHLGANWNIILAVLRKRKGVPPHGWTVTLRVIGTAIAVSGFFAFFRRQVGAYLTGQIQFAFFDFSEPLALFFLDYLAILEMFVWAGHYLGQSLQKHQKKTPSIRKDC